MKLFLCLFILCFFGSHAQSQTDSLLTGVLQPADMQADFRYLRRMLEETHPGLYRYTLKDEMQAKLDSIDQRLSQPLPFYAFFKTVSGLLADIRCAHTHTFPGKNWQGQFNSTLKTIPHFVFSTQERTYILFNGTNNQTVEPGFELLSINGQPMASIRKQLYRYHWDDGYNESSKIQVMRGQLFALFYYWYVGQPDTYHITFRTLSGDTIQVDAPAKPFGESLNAMLKSPVNKQMVAWYYIDKKPKHPWRLSFPDSVVHTAILRLDEFGGEGAKNGAQAIQRFQKFMDKTMMQLKKRQIRNLVVDVRGNTGGWDSQGIELLTYLMKTDSAVPYYARQHSVADSSEFLQFSDLSEADRANVKNELIPEPDGTFTLKQGSDTREPKRYSPKPNHFRGQVYMLMDGESASTASEFLAVAHANKAGTFIGVESGGAYEGGNGGSFINLTLPKTGIQVTTPLVSYNTAVPEPERTGHGILPDYYVPIAIDNVLNHTDSQWEFVIKLIREGGNK